MAYANAAITSALKTEHGKLTVQLLQNPSHLGMQLQVSNHESYILSEAINPVVLGKTRGKQYALIHTSDSSCMLGDKAMSVQLHGDAAFTGQGVVMESLGLSEWLVGGRLVL